MKSFQGFSVGIGSVVACMLGFVLQKGDAVHYEMTPLVSNVIGAAPNTDPNLVNPWGLFFAPNGNLWTADNGSDLSTLYQPDGTIVNFVINVPGGPTGAVRNFSMGQFQIGNGTSTLPSSFLFATEAGTILGFNSAIDPTTALLGVDSSGAGSIYKGLETATNCCNCSLLFVTDFFNGKVDVFDGTFTKQMTLVDPLLPAGYAPFNALNIGDLLYVSYAKQLPPLNEDDEPGPGNGYVSVFSVSGIFKKRLISQGNLNSPWGLALAPNNFGEFSGALLVGNFGDGLINAYDVNTGAFLGQVSDLNGIPIQIPGLWALKFDANGVLYFTSGPNNELDGLVGSITPL